MPTDDGFYFRWGIGPNFNIPFGSTRGRGGGGGNYAPPARVPPPPTPAPPPPPTPSTFPRTGTFPGGPAANDPVFNRKGFGRWFKLGRFGPWGNAVIIAVEVLKEIAEAKIEKEIEEAEKADRDRERQRAADRQGPREIIVRDDPLSDPIPAENLPNFPVFEPYPARPRPEISPPRPVTPDLPSEFPDQTPIFDPVILPSFPGRTVPTPLPGQRPVTMPTTHPGNPVQPISPNVFPYEVFFPRSVPVQFPVSQPVGFPVSPPPGDPLGLTGPQPLGLSFPGNAPQNFALPQDQAERCPQRRCKEDKRARRKCYKKFVWEGRRARDDIERRWEEIDCNTGRQLPKGKRKPKLEVVR